MRDEARVADGGRIVLPSAVREALHIKDGDTVVFETDEDGVRLRPRVPGSVFAEYAGILREGEGRSIKDVLAEIREMRGHDE